MLIKNKNIETTQIRQLLRDPINREDDFLIGLALAQGSLNPRFMQSTPSACLRIESLKAMGKYGHGKIGASDRVKYRYCESMNFNRIIPERQYNPLNKTEITNGTKLDGGIPLSTFVNNGVTSFKSLNARKSIAKYCYVHSMMMNAVSSNVGRFGDYALSLAEGVYIPEPNQAISKGSILDLARTGRVAVYDVKRNGVSDPSAAFNIASYFKDNHLFQDLILSFDTVDPNQSVTAQIIIILPQMDSLYRGDFRKKVSTEFNFRPALQNGLAELAV